MGVAEEAIRHRGRPPQLFHAGGAGGGARSIVLSRMSAPAIFFLRLYQKPYNASSPWGIYLSIRASPSLNLGPFPCLWWPFCSRG